MTKEIQEKLQYIFEAVVTEREYQVSRWGTDADKHKNKPNDWVSYICNYATRWQPGYFAPYSTKDLRKFRDEMVKVATLAFAAIEATDEIIQTGSRPDVLDTEKDYETACLLPDETMDIPLAILGAMLRNKGFEVKFISGPVAMYRNQVVESRSYPWDNNLGMFDQYEGKIIFLYQLTNADGKLPDKCNDLGIATKVRFATL